MMPRPITGPYHDRDDIAVEARAAMIRNGMRDDNGEIFDRLLNVLRKYRREDFDDVLSILLLQNSTWCKS